MNEDHVGEILGNKEVSRTLPTAGPKQCGSQKVDEEEEKSLIDWVAKMTEDEGSSGATTVPAVGFWSSPAGTGSAHQIKQENVTVVKICSSMESPSAEDSARLADSTASSLQSHPHLVSSNIEAIGEVSITVPSTIDVDQNLSDSEHERFVFQVIEKLMKVTARATAMEAVGYWVLEEPGRDKQLMKEKVTIVSASCTINETTRRVVKETAEWLCTILKQEAVLVKIDAQAFLVREPKEVPKMKKGTEERDNGVQQQQEIKKEKKTKTKTKPRDLRRKKYIQLYKMPVVETRNMVHDCYHLQYNEREAPSRQRLWY